MYVEHVTLRGNKVAESAPMLILCGLGNGLLLFSGKGVNALGLRNTEAIKLKSRLAGVGTQGVYLHSISPLLLCYKPSRVALHARSSIPRGSTHHGSKVMGQTPAGLLIR